MTVLSAQSIRKANIFSPFHERSVAHGMSFGLSAAGYDVRIAEGVHMWAGHFQLASIMEHIEMPWNVIGFVHDKSTWARRGLAVQNTVIEPGWKGYLTIELTNHRDDPDKKGFYIEQGTPIAQIVFHWLDEVTEQPYSGKYQDQEAGPQEARHE